MRSQLISLRWIKPSAPPILTKAPKSAMLVTRPERISPSCRSSRILSRIISRVSVLAARSLRIRRCRCRSTSMTQTSTDSPTNSLNFSSGVPPDMLKRRLKLSCDAGIKPRIVESGTIRPPLLYPATVDEKLSPDFSSSSASTQLCSSTARTNERIRLPSWSSGVITYTGIALPSSKVAKISLGIESNSLPSMMPSDFAPMLTKMRLSERLAMMPSRISPAVGISRFIPSASKYSPNRLSMVTSGSFS